MNTDNLDAAKCPSFLRRRPMDVYPTALGRNLPSLSKLLDKMGSQKHGIALREHDKISGASKY